MARLPRLTVAGRPHLLIQRAGDAQPAFNDDLDRRLYVESLVEAARASAVAIHAYALTDQEVCLLATPAVDASLGRMMQRVGRRYVPAFNRRHGRQGSPWRGRFHAAAIDPEHYLLASIRYVEQAPMRSGAVVQAAEWPWSSAAHRVGRRSDLWLTEPPQYWQLGNTPFEREAKHEILLRQLLDDAEIADIRTAARGGWPLGDPAFVGAIQAATARPTQPAPRGRPRRKPHQPRGD